MAYKWDFRGPEWGECLKVIVQRASPFSSRGSMPVSENYTKTLTAVNVLANWFPAGRKGWCSV